MTAYTLPAPDAPAEDWGRLAVSLPGWRWMPGMRDGDDGSRCVRVETRHGAEYDAVFWDGEDEGVMESDQPSDAWPDPDDPATEGCMVRLLGARCLVRIMPREGRELFEVVVPSGLMPDGRPHRVNGSTLGRACIAAAAIGRWPGGEG